MKKRIEVLDSSLKEGSSGCERKTLNWEHLDPLGNPDDSESY